MAPTETFNPNARAQEREREQIAIGDYKYRRLRRVNEVNRRQRALERDATNVLREMNNVSRELNPLEKKKDPTAEDKARIAELDDKIDELEEQADTILFIRIAAALKPAGEKALPTEKELQEAHPDWDEAQLADEATRIARAMADDEVDPDELRNHLDIEDARALLRHLLPVISAPDPTELETSTNGDELD